MSVVESAEEMMDFAAEIAGGLSGGEVIGLVGELGAGKTHFVKGLARGLGAEEIVTSPTFTLLHEYPSGRLRLYHFDFYRLERSEELLGIGWEDYFEDRGGVVVAEWAERFTELMPDKVQWWNLEIVDETRRRIERKKP